MPMPGDAFEQRIRGHLNNLYGTLVAEHRRVTEHLEARKGEDANVHQKQPGLREAPPAIEIPGQCHPPTFASDGCTAANMHAMIGDALPNHADDHSLVDAQLSDLTFFSQTTDSEPLHSRLSGRARRISGSRVSRKDPGSDATIPEDHSLHKDGLKTPHGEGASSTFTVLEIWERPPVRRKSKAESVRSLDRLTAGSISFVTSDSFSSVDDCEGDGSAAHWLKTRLQRAIIPPSSMLYLSWEIFGLVFVAYDLFTIPLQIFDPPETVFTIFLAWLVRCFWTFDIPVSFLTGFVSTKGVVELRPAKVAMQYVRTRFGFDLVLVSCDWIEALLAALEGSEDAVALRLISMLRAVRLARLLRLIKSQKISSFIFEHIRSEGVKLVACILLAIFLLLSLIHVIACIWHGIRHESGISSQEEGTDRLAVQYFSAFHYVMSLFAGEQIQEPLSLQERLFIIVVLILALVVSAAFTGSLTTAMTQLQIIASKRSTQFASLNRYLSDYGISRELASRVQRNARHALTEQKRHTPESSVELMGLISDPLRLEIHYEVYSPILTAHPFFCLYNTVNHVGVRHLCHTAVCPMSLSRGDVIFNEFEVPVSPRMFFVMSGELIYVRCTVGQQNVSTKQWVAEGVLWTRWTHRGTLRTLTESRLLAIDAQRVANIMSTFPTHHGFNYAVKFVDNLNKVTNSSELTDISEKEDESRHMAACVFQELDHNFDVPWATRCRRPSGFSVGTLMSGVSGRRISQASARSGGSVAVVPGELPAS